QCPRCVTSPVTHRAFAKYGAEAYSILTRHGCSGTRSRSEISRGDLGDVPHSGGAVVLAFFSMNLQQLRYVVATAEHRTMTDAAKSLYIAQPALSRAIRDLERELGLTLFARSGRGVVVTPEGRKVVRLAREALGAVQQIAELASGASGGAGAELRIATTPALQPGLARVLVPRYNEEHPAVRVVPVPCEGRDAVVNAIRRQRAELGLTDLPVPPDLVGRPVQCHEMVLIAAAD